MSLEKAAEKVSVDRMSRPKVSVLITVYNGESYLAACIESVLAQTYSDFELIICNDGSTDRSISIIQKYQTQDGRIVVISRENKGFAASLNEMIGVAKGQYIAVLDADDLALPERLALQSSYLDKHADIVCLGGDTHLIDEKGRYLTTLKHLRGDSSIQQSALAGHGVITHSCAMMRAEVLQQIGGYNPEFAYADDLDLWLRIGEHGKLENLEQAVAKYRLHTASITHQNGLKQRQVAKLACEAANKRRGIQGHFEAEDLWRPSSDTDSKHKFMLQYGWWAWRSKEQWTAFIYGLKAIRLKPFVKTGWVLLLCAILKPVKTKS